MGTAYDFEMFILEKSCSLCYSHTGLPGVEIHKLILEYQYISSLCCYVWKSWYLFALHVFPYEEENDNSFAVKAKKSVQVFKYKKGIGQLKFSDWNCMKIFRKAKSPVLFLSFTHLLIGTSKEREADPQAIANWSSKGAWIKNSQNQFPLAGMMTNVL